MEKHLTQEELRQMVVNSIRENGLTDVFKEDSINEIVGEIVNDYRVGKESEAAPSEIIPEGGTFSADATTPISSVQNDFPHEEDILSNKTSDTIEHDIDMEVGQEVADETLGQTIEPVMYKPELPAELIAKEPSEFIVWDYNELSVGGENLTNKPFGTLENPESKMTMMDAWKNEGKSTAKVFVAKFEEIGEVHFDYVSGQSHFIENGKSGDVDTSVNTYHENPYATQATPQVDHIATETDLAKTIESSVDLEKMLEKVLKDIIQKGLADTTERVEDQNISAEPPVDVTIPAMPAAPEPVNEDDMIITITEVTSPYGGFKKEKTPKDLKLALSENNKPEGYSIREMKDVTEYCKDDKCYYVPQEPMSLNKCYIKS